MRKRRFLIIGLPRSGTTYLMMLLNAHPAIHRSGEQFNHDGTGPRFVHLGPRA
ncbi:LPS sulfotransferase NodH [Roseovarius sp. MBR-79]|jgi:LPS sulfotransferase NodH